MRKAVAVDLRPVASDARVIAEERGSRRVAWRDAAVIWLAQHVSLILIIYIGKTTILAQLAPSPNTGTISWASLFQHWDGWDGSLYAIIAQRGYHGLATAAFPPLLPAIERAFWVGASVRPALAGLIVANIAELGAFGLFHRLVERESDLATARRALIYLAIFPTAFYLALPYTESLFLLLSIGVFLAVRGRRWMVAGALVALATLTRQTGILLCIPLLVEYWRDRRDRRAEPAGAMPRDLGRFALALSLPVLTTLAWYVYLYHQFGTFAATSRAEQQDWGRGLAIPVIGFARAGNALLQRGTDPNVFQMHILLDGAFTLLFVGLVVAMWRRLPARYSLYCAALLLVVVSLPAHNWLALSSNMRYMLGAFPIFMLLGRWGQRERIDRVIWFCSLPLLALFTLIFFLAGWVA